MKRSGAVKFPHSVQLFKFCQKVMMHQKGTKVQDQEVGSILNFNPSDCSHWKRGEKNVRSVFALAKLAEALGVETSLIHDITSGQADLDEAFFEYTEARTFRQLKEQLQDVDTKHAFAARQRVLDFVARIQQECEFQTPPLYLPEVLRTFAFITTQPVDMLDKLSRILRVKAGQYCIQYKKGEMKAQTRMSIIKDLARILFEGERSRFPEFGPLNQQLVAYEGQMFVANLMLPRTMLLQELGKLDTRRNVITELATIFWVPKSLISYQLQEIVCETMQPIASIENLEPTATRITETADILR
jgi:coenzyme F420-reducing hydrogenase delta subunit